MLTPRARAAAESVVESDFAEGADITVQTIARRRSLRDALIMITTRITAGFHQDGMIIMITARITRGSDQRCRGRDHRRVHQGGMIIMIIGGADPFRFASGRACGEEIRPA
jgi:hypothetical protein